MLSSWIKVKLWNTEAISSLHHVSFKVDIGNFLISLNELLADLLDSIQVVVQLHELDLAVRASSYFSDVVEVLHREPLAFKLILSPLMCLLLALWLQG